MIELTWTRRQLAELQTDIALARAAGRPVVYAQGYPLLLAAATKLAEQVAGQLRTT